MDSLLALISSENLWDVVRDARLQGMWIEGLSALLGVISVWLQIKRSVWCWPVGLGWAALSVWVYYSAQLFSDMTLGGVYCALMIFGWYSWLYGGKDHEGVRVSRIPLWYLLSWIAAGFLAMVGLGYYMAVYQNASVPFLDATTTSFSLVAQYLLTRKFIANWGVWIFVDVLATGIYIYKDLWSYVFLYAFFTILAVMGYLEWRKVLHEREQAA